MAVNEKKLNSALKEVAQEQNIDDSIDVTSLGYIVGTKLDDAYVSKNLDVLNINFKGLAGIYGFDSFYDLYLFAEAHDSVAKSTSKNKDTSKLQLVQRTVMRRGKPTTLSFYQDPDKGNKPKSDDSGPGSKQEAEEPDDTLYFYWASDKFGYPTVANIAWAEPPASWYQVPKHKYSSTLYDYGYYVQGTTIAGVFGLSKQGEILDLAYISADTEEHYRGILYRALQNGVKAAYENKLGFSFSPVTTDESIISENVLGFYGMKLRAGTYKQTYKQLVANLGEPLWEN